MTSILQQQIADRFLTKLAESGTLDAERTEQLRVLLTGKKKVKADDLVKLFSASVGGDIK